MEGIGLLNGGKAAAKSLAAVGSDETKLDGTPYRRGPVRRFQPLMILGSSMWCWGQMERGFW